MRYIIALFWLIIVVLAIVFVTLNSYSVSLNYYVGMANLYMPLLLVIAIVVGIILGVFAMLPIWLRAKSERRKLKSRLAAAELELKNLRNIPIKDAH